MKETKTKDDEKFDPIKFVLLIGRCLALTAITLLIGVNFIYMINCSKMAVDLIYPTNIDDYKFNTDSSTLSGTKECDNVKKTTTSSNANGNKAKNGECPINTYMDTKTDSTRVVDENNNINYLINKLAYGLGRINGWPYVLPETNTLSPISALVGKFTPGLPEYATWFTNTFIHSRINNRILLSNLINGKTWKAMPEWFQFIIGCVIFYVGLYIVMPLSFIITLISSFFADKWAFAFGGFIMALFIAFYNSIFFMCNFLYNFICVPMFISKKMCKEIFLNNKWFFLAIFLTFFAYNSDECVSKQSSAYIMYIYMMFIQVLMIKHLIEWMKN